ncbi:MAG: pyridoxal phosphate-dependent aminotransferase [Mycetocola reblochoni]|uniref:Aspartate aminotransferase n=2 Tax=Mycetocola reblochoni TaxID=331618 RepID=A0A1R4IQA8_9MICO|nr:pyridoxal phosphate-dependent aminotransferase [Mycetocola reblochoni]SJN21785.1 Aspartate aminotransferase [Mycetocola reblochoni REB411]
MTVKTIPLSLPDRILAASRRPATLGLVPAGAISLAMGEPDGGSAPDVVEAAVTALRAGRTTYAPLTGLPELRERLAARTEADSRRPTTANEIVLTHGASGALAATILACLSAGDRVLLPEPTYSLYADQIAMVGAEAVGVPLRTDGTLDLDRLAELAPTARMIIVCNPANPTGHVLDADEVTGLAALLTVNPGLLLLSDEAYGSIVFDGVPFISALTLHSVRDQVITVGTFSKSWSMTGWRLGWVVAEAATAARIALVHRTVNGALNTFVQDAALVALDTPAESLAADAATYQRRRDLVLSHLSDHEAITMNRPTGAFYAFPLVHGPLNSTELVAAFADGGVLLRAGTEYGPSGEGHVRISFATDDASLVEGLARMRRVLDRIGRPSDHTDEGATR